MRIEERAVRGGRVEGGRRRGAADLGVGIVETCVRDVWKGIETVAYRDIVTCEVPSEVPISTLKRAGANFAG